MAKRTKSRIVIDILTYVLAAIVIFLAVIFLSVSITSKQDTQVPSLFGTSVLTVESESMTGTFNKGDLITIQKLTAEEAAKLEKGDIITYEFYNEELKEKAFNTHRITEVLTSANGGVSYKTKGDNNTSEDKYETPSINIVGVYKSRIPWVGNFISFLRAWYGFVICIILPLAIFFIYRVVVLVKVIMQIRKDNKPELASLTNEDYEKLLKEVDELRAKVETTGNKDKK